jgi:transcriptional regulator with XRE-family HTH domain
MSKFFESLLKRLRKKEYRKEFVSARVAAAVSAQVSALRQKNNWTQAQLAEAAQMKQARISLIEHGDYENFTLGTLKRLASAFDVGLIVEFVSFPKFLRWVDVDSSASVIPNSFAEDFGSANPEHPSVAVPEISVLALQERESPMTVEAALEMLDVVHGLGDTHQPRQPQHAFELPHQVTAQVQ